MLINGLDCESSAKGFLVVNKQYKSRWVCLNNGKENNGIGIDRRTPVEFGHHLDRTSAYSLATFSPIRCHLLPLLVLSTLFPSLSR